MICVHPNEKRLKSAQNIQFQSTTKKVDTAGGREGAEEGRKQSVYVIKIGERGRNAELRGTAVAVSFVLVIRI